MIATGSRPLLDRDSRRARQAHGEDKRARPQRAAHAAEVGEGPRRLDVEPQPQGVPGTVPRTDRAAPPLQADWSSNHEIAADGAKIHRG